MCSEADLRPHACMQGVYELYDVMPGPEWAAADKPATVIVLIGRNMKRSLLESTFAACME